MKYRAAMLAHCEGARVVAGAITVTVVNFTFGLVIEEQASPPLTHMHLSEEFPATDNRFPALAAVMAAWQERDNDMLFNTDVRAEAASADVAISKGETIL